MLIALFALLVFGLILRLVVTFVFPNIDHPDEIYQTLEQARRLTTGYGFVPWEYVTGIRSWALPGLFAGLMEAARIGGTPPDNYLRTIHVFMDLVSLLPIVCGFLWGRLAFGLAGGIVVGVVNATWAELIYFAPHTLTEVVAGDVLVLALYLAYPDRIGIDRRRLFLAGIVFGLTFVLRFHIAPAIAVAVVWICGAQLRQRWAPLIAGACLPVLASGVLDTLTWGYPFQSIWLNAWVNIFQGMIVDFGIAPWFYILGYIGYFWGGAFAFIITLAILGARRLPLLLAVAVTIVAAHSFIGHKEYRFIYPALPLIITLAGIGTVELVFALWGSVRPAFSRSIGLAVAAGMWVCVSASLFFSAPFQFLLSYLSGEIAAFRELSANPALCGVALYHIPYYYTPGYTYLRPGIIIHTPKSAEELVAKQGKFNAIIAKQSVAVPAPLFTRQVCFPNGYNLVPLKGQIRTVVAEEPICIWLRAGSCAGGGAASSAATAHPVSPHPD